MFAGTVTVAAPSFTSTVSLEMGDGILAGGVACAVRMRRLASSALAGVLMGEAGV